MATRYICKPALRHSIRQLGLNTGFPVSCSLTRGFSSSQRYLANKFSESLQELQWLEEQREQCNTIQQQLQQLEGKQGVEEQQMIALYQQLEVIQSLIAEQEAMKKRLTKEFLNDKDQMRLWIAEAGVSPKGTREAVEGLVKNGWETKTLYKLKDNDVRRLSGINPMEKDSIIAKAKEEYERSQEKQDADNAAKATEQKKKLKSKLYWLLTLLCIYGIYKMMTSETFKAALAMVKGYRPKLVPEIYIPRDDVEDLIKSRLHVVPKYTVITGPSGSGKTSAAEFACRRSKGVIRVPVRAITHSDQIWARIASTMGLSCLDVEAKKSVESVFWWVAFMTRHAPTLVLDVMDTDKETIAGVQDIAKYLSCTKKSSAVMIVASNTATALPLLTDPSASVQHIRELTEPEAKEMFEGRVSEVGKIRSQLGLQVGTLARILQESLTVDEVLLESKKSIQAYLKTHPQCKPVLKKLASQDYPQTGVPVEDLEPEQGAQIFSWDGKKARFAGKSEWAAANQIFGSWW